MPSPCPSPTITHKHFRATQGRKPCLAISPTPLETFSHSSSELFSAGRILHFCSQTLLGSNWNKSKTARRIGQL